MSPNAVEKTFVSAWQLRRAARWLRRGGIVAYPAEAVYGVGCDPRNEAALRRLLALKQRPWQKGLIVIGHEFAQLEPFLVPQAASLAAPAHASWPGAVTWLWPARTQVSRWLRGQHASLAVRIPASPVARALCRAAQSAIISTSANLSGQHPARSALEVRRKFGAHAPLIIVHGAVNRKARPSQILDLLSHKAVRS